jgi:cell division protein FtsA
MGIHPENLIVGVDIGSSKVAVIVAERDGAGALDFLDGIVMPMRGIRQGVVVDIHEASGALAHAFEVIEERFDHHLNQVTVNIGGRHIRSRLSYGRWTASGREILDTDIDRAAQDAKNRLAIDSTYEIIHEVPRTYVLDGQAGVRDPRGLTGFQLEAEVHYTTGASATITNLERAIRSAGLIPMMFVASPVAAGEAVRLGHSDQECFVVADIGAETTSIAAYVDGAIWASGVEARGGKEIIRDVARQFHLPLEVAEDLLTTYGTCAPGIGDPDEFEIVPLPGQANGNTIVPRAELARVIRERAENFATAIAPVISNLRNAGYDPDTLVLTGGTAALDGLDTLLANLLEVPAERGLPKGISGMPQTLAGAALTAVGLALWHARYQHYHRNEPSTGASELLTRMRRLIRNMRPTTAHA